MTTNRKAKSGGEVGANGSFYRGGTFINTVPENAKGSGAAKFIRTVNPLTDEQRNRTAAAIAATEQQIARGEGDAEMLHSYIRSLTRQLAA